MSAPPPADGDQPAAPERTGGILSRHPKLAILVIAGIFYAVLIGMALFVLVLVIRG